MDECGERESQWLAAGMGVGKKRYKSDQQYELALSKREVTGPLAPEIQPFRYFLLLTKLDTQPSMLALTAPSHLCFIHAIPNM